jgi:hypothetical protein
MSVVLARPSLAGKRRLRAVRSLRGGGGSFETKNRRRGAEFFAAAEVSRGAMQAG